MWGKWLWIVFTAHRTEPTATVSRPADPDDSSGIVASVKGYYLLLLTLNHQECPECFCDQNLLTARLKAPLPAPSSSSAQMICGLQHVEPGCRHVVLNCDKHRVQPNIPAAVAMETEDHCPAAVVATDSQVIQVTVFLNLFGTFTEPNLQLSKL